MAIDVQIRNDFLGRCLPRLRPIILWAQIPGDVEDQVQAALIELNRQLDRPGVDMGMGEEAVISYCFRRLIQAAVKESFRNRLRVRRTGNRWTGKSSLPRFLSLSSARIAHFVDRQGSSDFRDAFDRLSPMSRVALEEILGLDWSEGMSLRRFAKETRITKYQASVLLRSSLAEALPIMVPFLP